MNNFMDLDKNLLAYWTTKLVTSSDMMITHHQRRAMFLEWKSFNLPEVSIAMIRHDRKFDFSPN